MKTTFSDRKNFIKQAIKPHFGILGIGFAIILFGVLFAFIGLKVENGLGFIIFGGLFIALSLAFMLYTLPSSFMYYYEQAEIKKYGSYTTAKVINKRVDDYSHSNSTFNGGSKKTIETYLYVVVFEFTYNNTIYNSECFFEHKSTYDAIAMHSTLPIKFLKTKPQKVTLRRKKLANQLGVSAKMCQ